MKHTGDTRESAAITVVQQLIAEKAHLAIYKPQVSADQVFRDLEYEGLSSDVVRSRVTVCHDAVTACDDASAVVILTEWDHFKTDQIQDLAAHQLGTKRPDTSTMPAILDDEDSGYTSEGRSCGGSNSGIDIANASELPTVIKPTPPARVDWLRIGQVMRRPKLIFDGRNVVEPEALAKLGFKVECIGKPKRRLLVV